MSKQKRTKLNVNNLRGLLEGMCKIKYIKEVARPLPDLSNKKETREMLLLRLEAHRHVIEALIQSTAFHVSNVEEIDAEELLARIQAYFDECDNDKKRSYTVPGLGYAIGFTTRQDFLDFVKEYREEKHVAYLMSRALMIIEDQRNVEIIAKGGVMAGHRLDLATNFDWTDARSGKKEDDKPAQQTNIMINTSSLPPEMSVEEWQKTFVDTKRMKPQAALEVKPEPKVEVEPKIIEKKKKVPKEPKINRVNEARKKRYFAKKKAKGN